MFVMPKNEYKVPTCYSLTLMNPLDMSQCDPTHPSITLEMWPHQSVIGNSVFMLLRSIALICKS